MKINTIAKCVFNHIKIFMIGNATLHFFLLPQVEQDE